MAEKLFLSIDIEGKGALKSVRSFSIFQDLFAHHSFEVVVPVESFVTLGTDVFDEIGNLVSKDIEIDWETSSFKDASTGSEKSVFKGIITDVSVSGHRKEHMMVSIKGKSPTILIDGTPHSQCYADMKLGKIYDTAVSKHLSGKLVKNDNSTISDSLPFTVQYGETDFDFLKRVCYTHGEWFYYDGQELSIGISPGANSVELTPDKVSSLDFNFHVVNPTPKITSSDYLKNEDLIVKSKEPKFGDSIASQVYGHSKDLFPGSKEGNYAHPSLPQGDDSQSQMKLLEARSKFHHASNTNGVMVVTGTTDHAEIALGTTLSLKDFGYDGEYVVTSVSHFSRGKNNYQNRFEAIPSDITTPPKTRIQYPSLSNVVARVVDNEDPEQLGRVKVMFNWSGDVATPWLRMVQPHAGDGRGFYFVPEVDDEVMVGFEMGIPDFPYVIGAIYNGKKKFDEYAETASGTKAIKTKSGHEIVFHDEDKKLIIKNEKNTITLDFNSNGVLSIESNGDIEIKAKQDISLDADKNIKLTAKQDITLNGMNVNVNAKQNFNAEGKAAVNLKGMNATLEGQINTTVSGSMTKIEAKAMLDVKAAGIANISGAMIKLN